MSSLITWTDSVGGLAAIVPRSAEDAAEPLAAAVAVDCIVMKDGETGGLGGGGSGGGEICVQETTVELTRVSSNERRLDFMTDGGIEPLIRGTMTERAGDLVERGSLETQLLAHVRQEV